MKRAGVICGLFALIACRTPNPDARDASTVTPVPSTVSAPSGGGLAALSAANLCVTTGAVAPNSTGFEVRNGEMRAVAAGDNSSAAELAFTYRGPSRDVARLGSGELRRQIGLKLRAKDTCNVVYVMWHIAPTAGIFVLVKHNPGDSTHGECGTDGYTTIKRSAGQDPKPLAADEAHTLRADLEGHTLRVLADGELAFEGVLPPEAFTFDGPAGVRTDNGAFDFSLKLAASSAARRASCPAHSRSVR